MTATISNVTGSTNTVHEHDLVLHDEEPEPAESRRDHHDVLRHREQMEAPRDSGTDADIEVHVARSEARGEVLVHHDVVDSRPLLFIDRYASLSPTLREAGLPGAALCGGLAARALVTLLLAELLVTLLLAELLGTLLLAELLGTLLLARRLAFLAHGPTGLPRLGPLGMALRA